jgi:hypothetical protein
MEFNEYRAKIYGLVKGALFIDAGNICYWMRILINQELHFSKKNSEWNSRRMEQDCVLISFLILRQILAFPIRETIFAWWGNRWVLDQISFGNGSWRKENLIFNFGYWLSFFKAIKIFFCAKIKFWKWLSWYFIFVDKPSNLCLFYQE